MTLKHNNQKPPEFATYHKTVLNIFKYRKKVYFYRSLRKLKLRLENYYIIHTKLNKYKV